MDNRRFTRLIYEVLDHNPREEDITRFFTRFREALQARGLSLQGVTTDGSPLYPTPIAQVFGPVPHQVCQFHVIAELNKAVLKAVAKVRRQLKTTLPKLRTRIEEMKRRIPGGESRISVYQREMRQLERPGMFDSVVTIYPIRILASKPVLNDSGATDKESR